MAAVQVTGAEGPTVLVPGRVVAVPGVLTPEECQEWIDQTERLGYKESPPSGGGHGQTGREGARTSWFRVMDNEELARVMWPRLKDWVPKNLYQIHQVPTINSVTKGDEYTLIGVSDHFRFYRYEPGQHILKHDDPQSERFRRTDDGQYFQQTTFFTLLVYLNDDFEEGHTCFWTQYGTEGYKSHCRFLRETVFAEADLKIKPVQGTGVISDHMMQHEGLSPVKGVKYVLRADIVHEKPTTEVKAAPKFKGVPKSERYSKWIRRHEPSCASYSE